ncbi:MAG: flagellar biosynthetic protein FliR [Gammaproteobacteria bacterium]|nr:MAG: flagellar biosynthetic protein FliR [Gammaproteobacteria bacterium]
MHFTDVQINALVGSYLWPFLRVGALVSAAPIFGTRFVPFRFKIILALTLTSIIVPAIPSIDVVPGFSPLGLVTAIQQVVIGLAMGFSLQLVFGAYVLGGQVMAMGMGLGFASMNDPANGVVVPTVGQFYTIMVTLIFLSLDGHLVTIEVLADSFRTMPVGPTGLGGENLEKLVLWGSFMYISALKIALPVISALLTVNIGFAIVTRAAPQLNIFAIGFPVITTLGFLLMLASLPGIVSEFPNVANSVFEMLRGLVDGGG